MAPTSIPTLRSRAEHILRAAIAAADPAAAVGRALRREGERLHVGDAVVDLAATRRVLLVGAGKACRGMAAAAAEVLGDRLEAGVLTVPHGYPLPADGPGLEVWEAAHPVPDTHGLAAAARTLDLARTAGADDLVLCLLSGGASALWPAPPSGVSLAQLRRVTASLLRAGAPIEELNAVRKHLSRIAGGQFARAVYPARLEALVASDVVGSPLHVVASGPTVSDPTTFADALRVLERRSVDAPPAVLAHLRAGAAGHAPETPGAADPVFRRAGTHLVLSSHDALGGAAREATRLGFRVGVVSDRLEGEAADVARAVVGEALRVQAGMDPAGPPRCLLWGGETTVTVRGEGRGGRNQELALAAALQIQDLQGVVIGSLATDGVDGPTDAAGGIVDGGTVAAARAAGVDPAACLATNDSHRALGAAAALLVTAPTGTNVNDVTVALLTPPGRAG